MASVRRVRRIIRKIDPWTVLKVSFVFYSTMALAFILGLVILWSVIVSAGIPDKINDIAREITLITADESLVGTGEEYFRLMVFLSVVWTGVITGLTTLGAVMYNLVTDIVGGIEVVVLEETLAVPADSAAVRRPHTWSPPEAVTEIPAPVSEDADQPTEEHVTVS